MLARCCGLIVPVGADMGEPGTRSGVHSRPSCSAAALRPPAVRRAPGRSVPSPTGVQGHLDISPSSSSSPVWKLGIEVLRAGQAPSRHVGPVWVTGGCLLSTRGHLDGRAQRPPAVHAPSPVGPRDVPSPCPPRPGDHVRRATELAGRPSRGPGRRPPVRRDRRSATRDGRMHTLGRSLGTAPGDTAAPSPAVTPRSRSPQGVHIPGDNSSTSRHRRGRRPPRKPREHGRGPPSAAVPGLWTAARRRRRRATGGRGS